MPQYTLARWANGRPQPADDRDSLPPGSRGGVPVRARVDRGAAARGDLRAAESLLVLRGHPVSPFRRSRVDGARRRSEGRGVLQMTHGVNRPLPQDSRSCAKPRTSERTARTMPNLTEALASESKKSAVEDDCIALIDAEVADKGGFTGLAIKAGYRTVQGIKPGFVRQVVTDLLPEFARALEPLYQEAKTAGHGVREHFNANAPARGRRAPQHHRREGQAREERHGQGHVRQAAGQREEERRGRRSPARRDDREARVVSELAGSAPPDSGAASGAAQGESASATSSSRPSGSPHTSASRACASSTSGARFCPREASLATCAKRERLRREPHPGRRLRRLDARHRRRGRSRPRCRSPRRRPFAAKMAELGIGDETLVVAYDDYDHIFAGRLAWALRYYGHDAVRILDGGWSRWRGRGQARSRRRRRRRRRPASPPERSSRRAPAPQLRRTADEVEAALGSGRRPPHRREAAGPVRGRA